jgi:cytochrome c oxidase assembly factor CtaG/putative copper export protein
MTTMTSTASRRTVRTTFVPGTAVLVAVLLLTAAAAVVVSMVLSGGTPRAASGLRDAGQVTGWVVPLTRGWLDVAIFATMGCLIVGSWLMGRPDGPDGPDGRADADASRILRLGGRWSLLWAVAASALAVSSTSQLLGASMREVLTTPGLYRLAWQVPQNRSLVVMALVALALALAVHSVQGPTAARSLLVVTGLAVAPFVVSGHAASASNHFLAAQSLLVHVLAASLWVGGLSVIVVHVRGNGEALRAVLPRFSGLALGCFVVIGLSGVLGAWTRLGTSWDAWASTYGLLVVSKTVALVVLGALGAAHRTWSLSRIAAGNRGAFLRFALAEAVVMMAAAGLAVVLARTAPPTGALNRARPPHANLFPTVDRNMDPLSPVTLLTEARPDAIVMTAAAVAIGSYLFAVFALRRRGESWRRGRTVLFSLGVAVALWAICGGLGSYSAALFSMQVAQLLTLAVVAPILITYGAPVTLARTVLGPGRTSTRPGPLARLVEPVNGLIVLVVVLAAGVMTPLLEAALRSGTLHTVLAGTALLAGLVFFWPLLRQDWVPSRRTDADDAPLFVAVLALLLVVYAAQIFTSTSLFAERWFADLGLSWSDPASDQKHAVAVVAAFAVALLAAAWRMRRSAGQVGRQGRG